MARTFGALFFLGPDQIGQPQTQVGTGAGQFSIIRNALGDVSLNNGAGVVTATFWASYADIKRPYITFPMPGGTFPVSNEYQELFGTAAGGPGYPFGVSTGGTQFSQPQMPWGVAIIDVFAVYSVATAALTAATLGLNRATYTNNTAFTNTAVLAATATAKLATTTSATTPYVATVSLAQPLAFETADISNIVVEMQLTTAGTSAVRVYGMGMHVAVEYS